MGAMVLGRRRSRAEWSQLVAVWERSGERAELFAARHGVTAKALTWWRWRLASDEARFVEVEVSSEERGFVVELADVGHRVEVPVGFDAHELRRLIDALC